MTARYLTLTGFLIVAAFITACQPASNRNKRSSIGRLAQGPVRDASTSGATWGQITSNNQNSFSQALYSLTAPMLSEAGSEEQLGFVSNQANQNTGVAFFGRVPLNGQINSSNSSIHIEIYDDKSANGSVSPVVLDLAGQQGSANGGQMTIEFYKEGYGTIALTGTISGSNFSGTVMFTNSSTTNQGAMTLGQFLVSKCGFFICN